MFTQSKKIKTMNDTLKFVGIAIVIISIALTVWYTMAYRDIKYLQKIAPAYIEQGEFTVTMYEGYQGNLIHGGGVWYQARDSSGYLYTMEVREWMGELHVYNVICLNAVKNE